nr:Y-box-binding protein 1-like [Symphalangus syndactylus]
MRQRCRRRGPTTQGGWQSPTFLHGGRSSPASGAARSSDAGVTAQGAGRPARQQVYRGRRPRFYRAHLTQDSLERTAMKRIKTIQEMRPKHQPPQHRGRHNFN